MAVSAKPWPAQGQLLTALAIMVASVLAEAAVDGAAKISQQPRREGSNAMLTSEGAVTLHLGQPMAGARAPFVDSSGISWPIEDEPKPIPFPGTSGSMKVMLKRSTTPPASAQAVGDVRRLAASPGQGAVAPHGAAQPEERQVAFLERVLLDLDQPAGQEPWDTDENLVNLASLAVLTTLVWCIVVFLAAYVYRDRKPTVATDPSMAFLDLSVWTTGPFDFLANPWIACCSCFCPCIRWADTLDSLGLVRYWTAVSIFLGLALQNIFVGGMMVWVVGALMCMSFRQQMRRRFNMDDGTWTHMMDCCLYCWCAPCAIAQEARHAEDAAKGDLEGPSTRRPR
mmetsp:Transcript_59676/g.129238  ORF Transcript_59676/g.129238 Transcript_59676/m.129238 type:complete len:340 (+) Transcript_59676:104-1123(+)